jgi:membrane protein involved in colicin uptake
MNKQDTQDLKDARAEERAEARADAASQREDAAAQKSAPAQKEARGVRLDRFQDILSDAIHEGEAVARLNNTRDLTLWQSDLRAIADVDGALEQPYAEQFQGIAGTPRPISVPAASDYQVFFTIATALSVWRKDLPEYAVNKHFTLGSWDGWREKRAKIVADRLAAEQKAADKAAADKIAIDKALAAKVAADKAASDKAAREARVVA